MLHKNVCVSKAKRLLSVDWSRKSSVLFFCLSGRVVVDPRFLKLFILSFLLHFYKQVLFFSLLPPCGMWECAPQHHCSGEIVSPDTFSFYYHWYPSYPVISSLCRLFVFPVSGPDVHVQTQHVFCGSGPREGGDRDVFPGSHPLPFILLALPHSLLPLWGRVQSLLQVRNVSVFMLYWGRLFFSSKLTMFLCLQVGLQWDRLPDHGLLRPLVVLFLLLLPSALLHLPDSGLCTRTGCHHRITVRLLCYSAVQRSQSR